MEPSEQRTRIIAIIPARLASTRLPGKVLLPIAGKPMLAWVYAAAKACPQLDRVIIATDAEEVMDAGLAHGWDTRMTSAALASGSDRVHALSLDPDCSADIYINIQGDEPLLHPDHIDALLRPFLRNQSAADATTLSTPCSPSDVTNPNVVKVVTAADGRALYFSRATIPFDRDNTETPAYRKHLGLYAYRKAALARFAALLPSSLEKIEKLEQLRMLENGMNLYVEPTDRMTIGVDTADDLARAEEYLLERQGRYSR